MSRQQSCLPKQKYCMLHYITFTSRYLSNHYRLGMPRIWFIRHQAAKSNYSWGLFDYWQGHTISHVASVLDIWVWYLSFKLNVMAEFSQWYVFALGYVPRTYNYKWRYKTYNGLLPPMSHYIHNKPNIKRDAYEYTDICRCMHNSRNDLPTNRDGTLNQIGVSAIELFVSSRNRYDMTSKRTVY